MATAQETLLIKIGADVTDLKRGLDQANKDLQKLDKTVQDAGKSAGTTLVAGLTRAATVLAGVVAAIQAASVAVNRFQAALADISAMGRLAQQTGIAVERLSELRGAAELAGVPFEVLQQSIAGFAQRLSEGLSDRLSSVSLALSSLGISARDGAGNLRGFDELLPQIADRISQFGDGLGKAQIAAALFGEEAGPRMLALLNQGAAGIARLTEEARRSGVVTQEQVQRAEAYRQATTQMQQAVDGLVRELATRLAPAVTVVADAITRLLQLLNLGSTATAEVRRLTDATTAYEEQLRRVNDQQERLRVLESQGRRQQADNLRALILPQQQLLEQLREEQLLRQLMVDLNARMAARPPPQAPDLSAQRVAAREAIAEAQHQLSLLQEKLSGQRGLFDEMNFQWFNHADVVRRATEQINRAYETSGERRRALANIERNIARMQQDQMLQTATVAAQAISSIFPKSKNAAIASAIINTAVGITRALSTLLPPWSWIQAGLIAATGAAQIATIRSTTDSGGGTAPSASAGGGQSPEQAEPSRMLTVTGFRPDDLFSGTMVRGLIDRINNEVQNGVTLISTRPA